MFSMWWGGGQPPVGVAGQPPAALMDRAMMGAAEQGQVVEVGGAAMEPVSEVVGFAPGRGPVAAGHHTAAVADDQGGALGGGDDPAGPADLQRLGGGATQGRGEPGRRCLEPPPQPLHPAGVVGRRVVVAVRVLVGGVAGDQDPGDRGVAGQPPAGLGVQRPGPAGLPAQPTGVAGVAEEAVQVDGDQQLGADPTALGEPAALQVAAGQLGQGIGASLATAARILGVVWGGPTAPRRRAGSGRPRGPTTPGGRPCPPRSATATAPAADGAARPGPRHRQGRRPAADDR